MRLLVPAIVVGLFVLRAAPAMAGGLEYTGQGAQSLARGGAVTAKAEDPMVLAHNPAGLAELRGSQFLINFNLALLDACVDPIGFYGWGNYTGGKPSRLPDPQTGAITDLPLNEFEVDPETGQRLRTPTGEYIALETEYYVEPLDTVCLDQAVTPVPQIVWSHRLSERIGIGAGLVFPSVQPSGNWGAYRSGIIRGASGELRPAPTRYMLLGANNLGLFPNVGLGVRLLDQLRVGFAFEWGIIAIDNYTMAAAQGGTTPANDIRAHLKAQDWFIPAFTASVHLVPFDELDAVLAFRFQDDIRASGDIDLTTGLFDKTLTPHSTSNIEVTSVKQSMPWKLRGGVRYASRFAPRPSGTGDEEADPFTPQAIHDPLQDERWDVELDVEYQLNSRNERQVIEYGDPVMLIFQPADPMSMPSFTEFPNQSVPSTEIEKHWKDQVSIRAGGTVNLMPGVLAVSGGAHYENRGIDPAYMQVDFWPVARVGLHTGLTMRVAGNVDIVLSYAHIFQETLVVAAPQHEERATIDLERQPKTPEGQVDPMGTPAPVTQIDKRSGAFVSRDLPPILEEVRPDSPDADARLEQNISQTASGNPPYIINAGHYRSGFDVFAAGVNVHF